MTGRGCIPLVFCLCMILAAAGCTSVSVGDVAYTSNNLTATISNPGTPLSVGVQATVYSLSEFGQDELSYNATTANLSGSENTVVIPLHLDPGKYRIFIYITDNGERISAVIRDITVQS